MTIEIKNINPNPIIPSDKIKFIMFPGAGLKNKEEAINSPNTMREIMRQNNISDENVEFHCFYYSDKAKGDIQRFNNDEYIDNNVEDIAKTFYQFINEDYKQTQENFSNIILQGHCQGAMIIGQIGNLLAKKMEQLQYLPEQIKATTSKITALVSGSGIDINKLKSSFTTYQFVNLSDRTAFYNEGTDGYKPTKILDSMKENFNLTPTVNHSLKIDAEKLSRLKTKLGIKTQNSLKYRFYKKDNHNFLVTNGLDIPDEEYISINKQGNSKIEHKEDRKIYKSIKNGHDLSLVTNPINIKDSPFMQELKKNLIRFYGVAIGNVINKENKQINLYIHAPKYRL